MCRAMADNVISAEVHEPGGGASLGRATLKVPAWRKVVIGVDDTDDKTRGATWSTMNEIACAIEREMGAAYLLHTISQLFPDNPFKTTNCCATAITFGVPDEDVAGSIAAVTEMVRARSYSEEAGMAWSLRIPVPDELREYNTRARERMVDISEAAEAADAAGAQMVPVTGERGCIGALAALGIADDPDDAVLLHASH